MTDLDKAREWAKSNIDGGCLRPADRSHAAAEIIQSLPDQWVDVEKVLEVISGQLSVYTHDTVGYYIAEKIARNLKALIAPKPPTLDDMTEDGRKACQWMQADVKVGDGKRCIITAVHGRDSVILFPDGTSLHWNNNLITPLPDLPKLEWPGSGDAPTIAQKEKVTADQQPNTSEIPKNSINPEDVPANEPWLIEANGQKAIGTRYQSEAHSPWSAAALNGLFASEYCDYEITLIHKLVPETHTLPEGMRLADHEEYGRVVVSPEDDLDGDYLAFYSDKNLEYGGSWAYPKEYELTFLDGEA